MCKVQVKAKNEWQNDDYSTANTNPNSSSLNDKAHHIRRRLSQTITSRHCLLITIALASLSAHACSDTVELQVTCDSGKTPWYVTSSNDINNDTTVTVGSCIAGHVENVAQVKGNDIDDKGIVLCAKQSVCYHLIRPSDGQINVKDCDGYGDPICRYSCHNDLFTRKKGTGDSKPDGTDREKIDGNIICDGSTDKAYTYKCDGNIVKKTPCPLGCDENGNQCKTNICKSGKQYECKEGVLFECRNGKNSNGKYIESGKACNDKGEVVFCKENELKQEMHTCEGDIVVFCKDNRVETETHPCADGKVVWCKPNEQNPLQKTDCYPSSQNDNFIACKDLNNSRRICDENGEVLQKESCSNGQTKCAGDLKGRVDCNGNNIDECQYCYNEYVNNTPVSIKDLGCEGCVPNEYGLGDSNESIFSTMNSICHNGKESKFNKIKDRKFLFIPESDRNALWEFALNVTLALSKEHSVVPANDQSEQTWRYYNCYNNAAMKFLKGLIESDDANVFLERLNESEDTTGGNVIGSKVSKTCCDDENSYYITRTGYRYYSVEKCTNIRLQNTNNDIIDTNFSAYAYTTELNDSLIGVEDDLLVKDSACLEVRDNPENTNDVRHMLFIKQQPDGKSNYGIYKAFECPENYKCDEKLNRLCISNPPQSDSNCKCNKDANTIMCGQTHIAKCPEGTTPRIVGDKGVESSCIGQSNLKLDQIRCVPNGKSTAKQ